MGANDGSLSVGQKDGHSKGSRNLSSCSGFLVLMRFTTDALPAPDAAPTSSWHPAYSNMASILANIE